MAGRFDIAKGAKPPEPEKLDIDPLVKYRANKNIHLIMMEFRLSSSDFDLYIKNLNKTLNKVQIANLLADYIRFQVSCRNYFNYQGKKRYHYKNEPEPDDSISI